MFWFGLYCALVATADAVWEACSGVAGTCIDVDRHACSAETITGACPGPRNIRCCLASGGIGSTACSAQGGICKRTDTCSSHGVLTGLCPGPSSVTCCTPHQPPSDFASAVVSTADAEFDTYGGLQECDSRKMSQRIGLYWAALGLDLDGCNRDWPWSAAFISYMVREAGGGDGFEYSASHCVYIDDAFGGGSGFYNSALDISSSTVRPGDLACTGRGRVASWTYADFSKWHKRGGTSHDWIPTHCDIVVAVAEDAMTVIGGNVGDEVTRRTMQKSSYAVLLPVARVGFALAKGTNPLIVDEVL